MLDPNSQPNALHHEDLLLINHVMAAVHHPEHLTVLNILLSQAEGSGWVDLVKAIRKILGGERNPKNLGPLDAEELPIVKAILKNLSDIDHIPDSGDVAKARESLHRVDIDESNYLKSVREQYEEYPYPKRDPEDEKTHLFVTTTEHLGKISHYCYGGMRDLREGGRFLVAGGGTGDAAIYLAEQLRGTNAEIVYVDLSSRSMDIARRRAAVRGLTNIRWCQNSLLELPALNLGYFDYINCCGVLHHLSNPSVGLQALSSVLKEDGCMGIMVYARYGRTAIYQIQELMRLVNRGEQDFRKCISNTQSVLANLPDGNWYKRDEYRWRETLKNFGDIEIFDLFLHTQDCAYSVPEVYEFARENNLTFTAFTGFTGQKLDYDFLRYFQEPGLVKRLSDLTIEDQQAIAELTNGCIKTHTFYLSRTDRTLADPANEDLVPYYTFKFVSGETLFKDLTANPGKPLSIDVGGGVAPLSIPQLQFTRFVLRYINGENSIREILARAQSDANMLRMNPTDKELMDEFQRIFNCFFSYELMYLRHYRVEQYKRDFQLG